MEAQIPEKTKCFKWGILFIRGSMHCVHVQLMVNCQTAVAILSIVNLTTKSQLMSIMWQPSIIYKSCMHMHYDELTQLHSIVALTYVVSSYLIIINVTHISMFRNYSFNFGQNVAKRGRNMERRILL